MAPEIDGECCGKHCNNNNNNKFALIDATSDPRQITGNMSIAEMPLALYNNLLRNT